MPMRLPGVIGFPLGGGISIGEGVEAPASLGEVSIGFVDPLFPERGGNDCSSCWDRSPFSNCIPPTEAPITDGPRGLGKVPDSDSTLFRVPEVGFTNGEGLLRLARASAVVLRFFRGKLFVGCGPLGLALGVVPFPNRRLYRGCVGPW